MPRFPARMIFPSPTARCAHRLPLNNKQGSVPAVIPVENLVLTESFRMASHIFVPVQKTATAMKLALVVRDFVRRFSIQEIR